MAVDLSVFGKIKTKEDFDRERQAFDLQKQLTQAQVKKAAQLDIDAMGEQAFYKAAQGLELTPQERAAAAVVDAKSGGIMYNPVTGQATQKPRMSDKISIGGSDGLDNLFTPQGGGRTAPPMAPNGQNPYAGMGNPAINQGYGDIIPAIDENMMGGGIPTQNNAPQKNQWDIEFETQMQAAQGNPRLQQSLMEAYAKSKLEMNDSQSKQAGYADRYALAERDLIDENKIKAYSDPLQRGLAAMTPFSGTFGNYLNSEDYKSYNQAIGNATTAKLRQESGAVINPSEFENDAKILYPQVGDSPEVLAQKERNRKAVLNSLQRGAGPAYKAPIIPKEVPKVSDKASEAETIFNAKKAVQKGADANMVRQRLIDAGIDPSKAGL